jgi:hypothetical protein
VVICSHHGRPFWGEVDGVGDGGIEGVVGWQDVDRGSWLL